MAAKKDKLTIAIEEQQEIVSRENTKLLVLVDQKEKKELIPLAKTYCNKCFKFRNSSGGPDRWWLYIRVIKIRGMTLHCITFQKTCYGQIEFNTWKNTIIWKNRLPFSDYTEITKEEFEEARKKLLQEIKTLGKNL